MTREQSYGTFTNKEEWKAKSFSLALGPAYRLNEYVSFYGLAGVNVSKLKYNEKDIYNDKRVEDLNNDLSKSTSLMYGAGVQINPIENVSIDFGYEGYRLTIDKLYSKPVHNFNVGLGYRF